MTVIRPADVMLSMVTLPKAPGKGKRIKRIRARLAIFRAISHVSFFFSLKTATADRIIPIGKKFRKSEASQGFPFSANDHSQLVHPLNKSISWSASPPV